MKNYAPVKRPERTVVVHVNNYDYVYLTEKVEYSSKLKRSVPKRTAIGKLNDEGLLIPNHNYFEIYGTSEEIIDPFNRSDFISVGMHAVISRIIDNLGLKELLDSIFDENSKKILDIATYLISRQDNAMYFFEDYGYSHSLFSEKNFSDNTIGKLFDEVNVKDIDLFIKSWVITHAHDDIYISYDSTNMNSSAGDLELVEYGHAKDDKDLPQINVSLGYNQTDNIPLIYELYAGSIIDNTECKKMVDRASYYGCKNVGFILDRGYFSIENIKYFEKHHYDYILMTKGNASFVQKAIEECSASLKYGNNNYLPEYELYGTTIERDLFSNDNKQYIHVYYDGIKAEKDKIEFNNHLNRMDDALEEKMKQRLQRKEDVKSYENYYKVKFDDNGYFYSYQRKDNDIKKAMDRMGYFVIITSKEMTALEALDIYRDRDAIEKVFRMEKSYLGFNAFRVHSTDKLESKLFISFIALIIRNEMSQKTKKLYYTNRKEYTLPKIIQQLERMGITRLSDNKYHERYALTARQKKIINSLGLTEKEYHDFIEKIKERVV